MSEQTTLEPTSPAALVVIDVQVAMVDSRDGDPPPYRRDEMLANINVLLAKARAAGSRVIYVRHQHARYEPMRPGHPGFEVHPDIAPLTGETVITKTACDSFCGTGLDAILRDAGIGHVVTCGMQTEQCVDTTSRSALHRGFNVTLASDAHSTWDTDALTAEQIVGHVNATLPNLPGPGVDIIAMPAAEIVFASAN